MNITFVFLLVPRDALTCSSADVWIAGQDVSPLLPIRDGFGPGALQVDLTHVAVYCDTHPSRGAGFKH